MSWSDPATDKQIFSLMRMVSNKVGVAEEEVRCRWLQAHLPTRRAMSDELGRVRQLCIDNAHMRPWGNEQKKQLFNSDIWTGYEEGDYDGRE